ncbi:hypothetical protein FRC19_007909 [Serendipita sp. 401]|nr:hypothetical protein FRC19_007909 [Serendipita sp. 401]
MQISFDQNNHHKHSNQSSSVLGGPLGPAMASKNLSARLKSPSSSLGMGLYLSSQSTRDLNVHSSSSLQFPHFPSSFVSSSAEPADEDWIVAPPDPPPGTPSLGPIDPCALKMEMASQGATRETDKGAGAGDGDGEGDDGVLPPYTNSIYLSTLCRRKREFHAAFDKTKRGRRGWEIVWLVLDGTALRIHKASKEEEKYLTTLEHEREAEKEGGTGKEKEKEDERKPSGATGRSSEEASRGLSTTQTIQTTTTALQGPQAVAALPPSFRPHLFRSSASDSQVPLFRSPRRPQPMRTQTSSPLSSSILSSTTSRLLHPASTRSSMPEPTTNPSHSSRSQATTPLGGGGGGGVKRMAAATMDLRDPNNQHRPLLKQYHLRDAICTRATTYQKRQHVVRFTLGEGKQFLVQLNSKREVAKWLQAMATAAPLALDLDERPMPDPARYPRRRRILLLQAQALPPTTPTPHEITAANSSPNLNSNPNHYQYRIQSRTIVNKQLNGIGNGPSSSPSPRSPSQSFLLPSDGLSTLGEGSRSRSRRSERRGGTARPRTAPGHLEPSSVHGPAIDNNSVNSGDGIMSRSIDDSDADASLTRAQSEEVDRREGEEQGRRPVEDGSESDSQEADGEEGAVEIDWEDEADSEMLDHLPIPRPPPSTIVLSLSSVDHARRRGFQL